MLGDTFSNSNVKLAGSDPTIYVFGTPSSFAPVLNSPDTFVNGSISGKFTQLSVINSTGNYEYPYIDIRKPVTLSEGKSCSSLLAIWGKPREFVYSSPIPNGYSALRNNTRVVVTDADLAANPTRFVKLTSTLSDGSTSERWIDRRLSFSKSSSETFADASVKQIPGSSDYVYGDPATFTKAFNTSSYVADTAAGLPDGFAKLVIRHSSGVSETVIISITNSIQLASGDTTSDPDVVQALNDTGFYFYRGSTPSLPYPYINLRVTHSDKTTEDVVVNQYISFKLHAGDTFSNSNVKLAGSDPTIYVFGTPSSFAPVLNSPDTFVNGSISGKFTQISVINSTTNYEYPYIDIRKPVTLSEGKSCSSLLAIWGKPREFVYSSPIPNGYSALRNNTRVVVTDADLAANPTRFVKLTSTLSDGSTSERWIDRRLSFSKSSSETFADASVKQIPGSSDYAYGDPTTFTKAFNTSSYVADTAAGLPDGFAKLVIRHSSGVSETVIISITNSIQLASGDTTSDPDVVQALNDTGFYFYRGSTPSLPYPYINLRVTHSDKTSEDVVVNQYISFKLHAGDTFSNSNVKLAGSDPTIYVFGTPSSFAPVLNSPDTFVNGSISGKFTQISVINSTGNYEYPYIDIRKPVTLSEGKSCSSLLAIWGNPVSLFT